MFLLKIDLQKLYTLLGREGEMKAFMKIFIRNNLGGRKKIHDKQDNIVVGYHYKHNCSP